ncbi:hypothetical protein [Sphingobium fluviale]|uniref:Uncharacterized protein n=1 Tax=Sphingobium fluviale TaxID=2506423 RepID=A0A4Q1KI27_9SPHN|nr:hypothetical protein [Sphingobium fluviale]RXR28920.1 hypothetical protein EQG66_07535 [Sphingobium fluviale]
MPKPNIMTLDEFSAILDRGGYVYDRTETTIDVKSFHNVNLSSLTTLPEGVTFSNGGHVYLSSLTTLPEGVTFSNGGHVYLSSLTTLPEGVTFSNGGHVDLRGLTEEYHVYRGERIRLKHVDGSTMLIRSERVLGDATIYAASYFGGGEIADLKACYVAAQGEYFAHGDTVEQAMRDVRFKMMEHDFDEEELVKEIKERGTVHINDFRLITGACESGTRQGMAEAGLPSDADALPLETVLNAVFGSYGERFKSLFERAAA